MLFSCAGLSHLLQYFILFLSLMHTIVHSPLAASAIAAPLSAPAALISVSLAAINATLLARILLQPHPQLLIDCGAQPCRRALGVCYFLSQLLLLRQQGASIWLSNADQPLRRHIRQLGLEPAFFLVD